MDARGGHGRYSASQSMGFKLLSKSLFRAACFAGEDPINFMEKIHRRLQLHRQLINRSAEYALEAFRD